LSSGAENILIQESLGSGAAHFNCSTVLIQCFQEFMQSNWDYYIVFVFQGSFFLSFFLM